MNRTVLALAVLALAGCIEESPQAHQGSPRGQLSSVPAASSPQQQEASPAPAPAPVPAPSSSGDAAKPAGAVFDGTLQVVAYRVDPPQASPGQTITVSVFLRVVQPITSDEQMFVHVDDSEGKPVRVNGDHWPANHKLPMPQWKVGEVVRDQFQVQLAGFEGSSAATIWMGFWDPARDARMTLTNAAQMKNDGNNRYALADVPIVH